MPDSLPLARSRWLFGIAIAGPLLSLIGLGVLSHQTAHRVSETSNSVREVIKMKSDLAKILIAMIDNETGQRGFIISQKPEFLEPYNRSLEVIPQLRKELSLEITDAEANEIFSGLSKVMDARLSFAAASVNLQTTGEHAGSVALVTTGRGKALMDEVRAKAAKLDQHFDQLLETHETNYSTDVRWNERICWLIVILDFVLGAFLVFLLLRLRRNEQILHVCAWSKAVEYEGEWITFESYLYRRFGIDVTHGISPLEAEKLVSDLGQVQGGQSEKTDGPQSD